MKSKTLGTSVSISDQITVDDIATLHEQGVDAVSYTHLTLPTTPYV